MAAVQIALVGAWAAAATLTAWATFNYLHGGGVGMDSRAYWLAGRTEHPYGGAPGEWGAFLYPPLFAQAVHLLAWLPWRWFFALFAAINGIAYWWLTGPLPWRWRIPVLALCGTELLTGNISALLALALVLSVTRSEALALPVLTKVAPGGVGFLWHLAKGHIRVAARGALATVALVLVSFAIQPHMWVEWVHLMRTTDRGAGGSDLMLRLVAAAALAIIAARKDRPGLLTVAFWLAMPMGGFLRLQPMTVMVAAVRLRSRSRHPAARGPATPAVVRTAKGAR